MQRDLNSRARIEEFIDAFYAGVLVDPVLAPIFLDVAEIELDKHLPHIKDYWSKLLLGEQGYKRHTMSIHRQLHARRSLSDADFARWLALFEATLDAGYSGPRTEKARRIARAIAANMRAGLPD